MLAACTSRPAQRGYRTSLARLLRERWHGVRGGEISGVRSRSQYGVLAGLRVQLVFGLLAPLRGRPLRSVAAHSSAFHDNVGASQTRGKLVWTSYYIRHAR